MSEKTCDRCTADTLRGTRCRNRSCRGTLCWQHLKKEHGMRVKPSGVAGAGLGLWTLRPITQDTLLPVKYYGEHKTRGQVTAEYGANLGEYVACNTRGNHCVDGKRTGSSVARYMNHRRENENVMWSNYGSNARGSHFNLRTIRYIPANTEIFIDYGDEYGIA